MIELFKSIAGYEGLYQVSNLGNVRRLAGKRCRETRVLKPVKHTNGYLYVLLYKDGNRKVHKIHRLVATAFIENPDNLPCINHIDENKTNNRVDNLEWCTHAYNNNYGTRIERVVEARSKKVLQLTLDGTLVKEWASTMECGRNGFNQGNITECCNGKRKTHKGFRWCYAD